jgi:hypothetical protein
MEVEQRIGTRVDERARTVGELTRPGTSAPASSGFQKEENFEFPSWSRAWPASLLRHLALPLLILPLTRLFAWIKVEGRENLRGLEGPVIFAANHQSHFDVPAIFYALPSHWRYRATPAMSREFFDAHFHPERHSKGERFTNSLNYFLSCSRSAKPEHARRSATRANWQPTATASSSSPKASAQTQGKSGRSSLVWACWRPG